jgi:circadian clock protein KaiC
LIERVKTGIRGFDELVQGGIPKGNTILLTGTPGTGKTIFGLEFLCNGAVQFKEKGLYVSFEQNTNSLIDQASSFGWDLESLIKKGQLEIIYIPISEIDKRTSSKILEKIAKEKIKRLVIDSISTLSVNAPIYGFMTDQTLIDVEKRRSFLSPPIIGDFIVKRFIYSFIDELHAANACTTLMISESAEKSEYLSRDTVSEFISDGVVLFTFESMGGEFSRSLVVRKMRNTKNDEDVHPLEISGKGLVVHSIKG